MLIGVISDTHDNYINIGLALNFFQRQKVDLIVHCGDWKSVAACQHFAEIAAKYALPVKGVLGNNDTDIAGFLACAAQKLGTFDLQESVLNMQLTDGQRLAAYHGHHGPTLRALYADDTIEFLLTGHTHKPHIENTGSTIRVNPGSTAFAIPRSREWKPTVSIVDTQKVEAKIHPLI